MLMTYDEFCDFYGYDSWDSSSEYKFDAYCDENFRGFCYDDDGYICDDDC